jgi:hypothetical protein
MSSCGVNATRNLQTSQILRARGMGVKITFQNSKEFIMEAFGHIYNSSIDYLDGELMRASQTSIMEVPLVVLFCKAVFDGCCPVCM